MVTDQALFKATVGVSGATQNSPYIMSYRLANAFGRCDTSCLVLHLLPTHRTTAFNAAQQRHPHLRGLSSHHHEVFSALHQEARKSVAQNRLDLVSLLYSDTNSHAVDAGFD